MIKVASFNVQKFGQRKVKNQQVFMTLLKIIKRYDIVVIMEVVDRSGLSIEILLDALGRDKYAYMASDRLGRGRYKEQYVFLYNMSSVYVTDTYQYDDMALQDCDVFARDPFIVRFKILNTKNISNLTVVPLHTKPVDSKAEIDGLKCVVEHIRHMWRTNNVMIVGDFNADGNYVSCNSMQRISIRCDPNYFWLVHDDEDTTTCTSNDHTYDRIVVYGKKLAKACGYAAKPFNYQEAYNMTEQQALAVSDHYPVEVNISI
ncbi:deoxyribonuclease 1 [European chub iridovirus]|nr:deoxyribonuclease 1 [European chub iridovirus]